MQFDIRQLDTYRENNRLEAKKAAGGLPNSLWETYSSMANCYGGVIILGATENEERSLTATGVTDVEAMKRDLWNGINNPQKVSVNLLSDRDVEICELLRLAPKNETNAVVARVGGLLFFCSYGVLRFPAACA